MPQNLTTPQKIAHHGANALGKVINIADSFVTNGALHGRNLITRPSIRDMFSRITPRAMPYIASLTSAQNLQMIGGALTIMFLTSVLSDEKNVQYAAEKLNTMSEYVTAEASATWNMAGNNQNPENPAPHFPHYL